MNTGGLRRLPKLGPFNPGGGEHEQWTAPQWGGRQDSSEPAAWLTGQVRGPGHTMSRPVHTVLWLLKSLQSGYLLGEELSSVALPGFFASLSPPQPTMSNHNQESQLSRGQQR